VYTKSRARGCYMISKEERNEKARNKTKAKNRKRNTNIKIPQIVMNFYIPTDMENMNKKVRLINLSVEQQEKTGKD
jgi:hypothetical protein